MLAAVNTSLTPCAITSRAASTLSLPLRALRAALCHARQISSACFLSRVFVERNTRLLVRVSGFQIERRRTSTVCLVDDECLAYRVPYPVRVVPLSAVRL